MCCCERCVTMVTLLVVAYKGKLSVWICIWARIKGFNPKFDLVQWTATTATPSPNKKKNNLMRIDHVISLRFAIVYTIDEHQTMENNIINCCSASTLCLNSCYLIQLNSAWVLTYPGDDVSIHLCIELGYLGCDNSVIVDCHGDYRIIRTIKNFKAYPTSLVLQNTSKTQTYSSISDKWPIAIANAFYCVSI